MSDENVFNPSLQLAYSIYLERVATLVQPHSSGNLSIFDKLRKNYYLVDISHSTLKQKIALELASGEHPEFGRVSISEGVPCVAYIEPSEESIVVLDGSKQRKLSTIQYQKGKIEAVALSPDGERVYTGGKDGHVVVWDVSSGKMLSHIAKHQDFVYIIKESPCGEYVASVAYDRTVFVYRKSRGIRAERIHVANVLPRVMCFLGDGFLALAEGNGEVVIVDCHRGVVATRFRIGYEEIIYIAILNDRTIATLSKYGKLSISDYMSGKVLSSDYLAGNRRYSTFAYDSFSQKIVVATTDGYIKAYSIENLASRLDALIKKNEVKNAYELIATHPYLREFPRAMTLEARFNIALAETKGLMEDENVIEAQALLSPYLQVPEKRMLAQKYIDQLRQLQDLRAYRRDSYLLRAYSLIQTRPLLAQTSTARAMDESFLKAIFSAKELLKVGRIDEAEKIVFIYKVVSSCSKIIKEVFANPLLIDTILEAVAQKDYRRFFDLKRQYAVVSILPESKIVEEREEELLLEIEEAFYLGEFDKVRGYIETLALFPKGGEKTKVWIDRVKNLKRKSAAE